MSARTSARASCFGCGRDVHAANYCPHCGVDLSPANERHYAVMRTYQSVAVDAAKKAEHDLRDYGDLGLIDPNAAPLTAMVRANCEAAADPDRDTRWDSTHDGPMYVPLLVERAMSVLESG